MRQLLPEPIDEVDPVEAVASLVDPQPGRAVLTLNMVASVDGATAIDGRSGGLGGPADRAMFRAVRATADVILAGATTVRTEGYRPPRCDEAVAARRVERGQEPHPRLAVLSGTLRLDPSAAMFVDPPARPLVLTGDEAPADQADRLAEVADIVRCGPAPVQATAIVGALAARGAGQILCEGGPTLNGLLVTAGLVDVVHLTLSPTLVAGTSLRVALSDAGIEQAMRLERLWFDDDDGLLLARYRRAS